MLTVCDVILLSAKTKLLAFSPIQSIATMLLLAWKMPCCRLNFDILQSLFLLVHQHCPHAEDVGDEEQVTDMAPVIAGVVRRLARVG